MMEPPFSAGLLERLDPAVEALRRRPTAWDPADPYLLRRWLVLVWQAVRASVPLLEFAAHQVGAPQTPFSELLFDYYTLHAADMRVQEELFLEDLASAGVETEIAALEFPNRHIADMLGSQYYLVRHYHPALLLGYLVFSEGHPPEREAIDRLRLRSGTSERAWRTYLLRAEEGPVRAEELRLVLDEVPPDPEPLRPAILVNALRCAAAYGAAVDSICQSTSR
jgi:hypothetical protein